MNRGEVREFLSERVARMEERQISMAQDIVEMKKMLETSFSSFGDMANRVHALEAFKKTIVLVASSVGSLAGFLIQALVSNWRPK